MRKYLTVPTHISLTGQSSRLIGFVTTKANWEQRARSLGAWKPRTAVCQHDMGMVGSMVVHGHSSQRAKTDDNLGFNSFRAVCRHR